MIIVTIIITIIIIIGQTSEIIIQYIIYYDIT